MVAPREILPFDSLNDAMEVLAETDSAERDIEQIESGISVICDDCDITFPRKPGNVEWTPVGLSILCDVCQERRYDKSCP